MRINLFAYGLILVLSFSCSSDNSPKNNPDKGQKETNPIEFNLLFHDSIAYGCRGMEVFEKEVYFSGIKGTSFKITKDFKVKSFIQFEDDSLDFRDISVVDKDHFFVINSGLNKGVILRYQNKELDTVYQAQHEGAFLDDLDQDEKGNLYCLGDPMPEDRSVFLLKSENEKDWNRIYDYAILGEDEFFFAASGSCMDIFKDTIFLAVGGKESYIMKLLDDHPGIMMERSNIQGGESSGINAMFVEDGIVYAVGGDYRIPEDLSITFEKFGYDNITSSTGGYQSTISKSENLLVCSGRNGTYFSIDDGKSWTKLMDDEFYKVILDQDRLYCSGPKGNIKIFEVKYARD